jgi:hypothetical protein
MRGAMVMGSWDTDLVRRIELEPGTSVPGSSSTLLCVIAWEDSE